jgi:hypothetical protein
MARMIRKTKKPVDRIRKKKVRIPNSLRSEKAKKYAARMKRIKNIHRITPGYSLLSNLTFGTGARDASSCAAPTGQ